MKASVLTRVAAQSILKNKMRSLLTMLGIIIGVGAVILLVAIGQGAQSRIQQQIENLGTNMLVISPGSSSQGGVSRGMGSFNRLKVDDVEKLKRESFLLAAVSPVIATGGQLVGGQGNWRSRINGVSVEYLAIRDWDVEFGRNFDAADVRSMKKVVLLGRTVVEERTVPDHRGAGGKGPDARRVGHGRRDARPLHDCADPARRPPVHSADPGEHVFARGHPGGPGRDHGDHAGVARPGELGGRRLHGSQPVRPVRSRAGYDGGDDAASRRDREYLAARRWNTWRFATGTSNSAETSMLPMSVR
jgi:hypothetical protein